MNKKTVILSTSSSIVFLDQLSKFIIKKNFVVDESVPITNKIFHLTYVTNSGSAFGLFKGFNILFIIFSIFVIFIIPNLLKKIKNEQRVLQVSVGLLLGGTIGNLVDRILYGFVVDFIDFRFWPVFNIADTAVTVSIICLILLL